MLSKLTSATLAVSLATVDGKLLAKKKIYKDFVGSADFYVQIRNKFGKKSEKKIG
jgi:hypothetical protein